MEYSNIIKRGWNYTWNNKFLWVLGFLAALGSGSGFGSSNFSTGPGDPQSMEALAPFMTPEGIAAMTTGLIAVGCVAFIIGILLWLVSLIARGGLINAVAELESGVDSAMQPTKPTFGSAFRAGWRRVARLAFMTILLFVVPIILFVVLVIAFLVPAFTLAIGSGGDESMSAIGSVLAGLGLVAFCMICLLVPLTIVLSFIYPFAFRGIVLGGLGVMDSIRHGWRVLRDNLGQILVLGLIFLAINILVWVVVAAIAAPIGFLVGVPLFRTGLSDLSVLQWVTIGLGTVVGLVIFGLISAIFTAWQSSTFTLAYLQWTGKEAAAAPAAEPAS
jgi:hypothetical protein